eukprot:CAMPEP_0179954712 /NCGR_PEP_ID=MMETSP0983-20121128/25680_1 /TAXON_ID=483367 /ORGANISM="non described non described, Strain CCMP 2436" /LENGTH=248 /DNA_ID=CAMNT_0021865867 /DNA_START=64 /DNA_END=808 /DNA_ORIENTATION=-
MSGTTCAEGARAAACSAQSPCGPDILAAPGERRRHAFAHSTLPAVQAARSAAPTARSLSLPLAATAVPLAAPVVAFPVVEHSSMSRQTSARRALTAPAVAACRASAAASAKRLVSPTVGSSASPSNEAEGSGGRAPAHALAPSARAFKSARGPTALCASTTLSTAETSPVRGPAALANSRGMGAVLACGAARAAQPEGPHSEDTTLAPADSDASCLHASSAASESPPISKKLESACISSVLTPSTCAH